MRLPFPERIPMKYAALFAAVLYVVEQLQGTDPYYSICVMLFILIATFAFNEAGGFTRTTGGYVFFYATLGSIVGWTAKAALGEAADSNLRQPNLTVSVFLGGMIALAVAVVASSRLRPSKAVLESILAEKDYPIASLGCALLGGTFLMLANLVPHPEGSLLSATQQIGQLLPLAIILGVLHQIKKTAGRRSVNVVVLLVASLFFIVNGLINFSKEGMFTPIVAYLVAVSCLRFRASFLQIAGICLFFYVTATYLVPYSQYGRNFKTHEEVASIVSFRENTEAAVTLLSDLETVRQDYRNSTTLEREGGVTGYFDREQGIFDRLQMIAPDDMLIDATVQGKNQYGLTPIVASLLNVVPHALWPEKPDLLFGNLYAHEIGGLIDDRDFTTGVSFSPSGQAYHMAGWLGVFLVAPTVWFVTFLVVEWFCGDTRKSPWALIVLAYYAHFAPEGMLTALIDLMTRYIFILALIALLCAYAMPFIAGIFVRPPKSLQPTSRASLDPV